MYYSTYYYIDLNKDGRNDLRLLLMKAYDNQARIRFQVV